MVIVPLGRNQGMLLYIYLLLLPRSLIRNRKWNQCGLMRNTSVLENVRRPLGAAVVWKGPGGGGANSRN